jgi:predicted DNA-binding transcriptional regulator YafY
VLETSARLLRFLSLLQSRRDWTGAELARRLDVTTRTVRNDVDRLRRLGYPVEARSGVAGGYRLGTHAVLPPLLVDDEEAVAIAVGLRAAVAGPVVGLEEASVRALAKLQQVLPSRLRHRLEAMAAYAVPIPRSAPRVDAEVLMAVASACRDQQRLRFDYRSHAGEPTRRVTEPHRLVFDDRHWYLLAWDCDRQDWRTFRLDRMEPRVPTGPRFQPRDLPEGGDVARHVSTGVETATWRYRGRVVVHAPAPEIAPKVPFATVTPLDDSTCTFEAGSDDPQLLALYLGMLGVDFEVHSTSEMAEALADLSDRFRRASVASAGAQEPSGVTGTLTGRSRVVDGEGLGLDAEPTGSAPSRRVGPSRRAGPPREPARKRR